MGLEIYITIEATEAEIDAAREQAVSDGVGDYFELALTEAASNKRIETRREYSSYTPNRHEMVQIRRSITLDEVVRNTYDTEWQRKMDAVSAKEYARCLKYVRITAGVAIGVIIIALLAMFLIF